MKFITSDLHLDHENVIKHFHRPFVGVADMRESIIDEINALPEGSTLYILGDFVISSRKNALRRILERLKPKLVFVPGNHDFRLSSVFAEFGVVDRLHEVNHNDVKIVMCHFPMMEWNRGQYGSLHMHGHTHGGLEPQGKMLDVAWDKHRRILSLDEAFALADVNPIYQPCHNKNNGKHRHEIRQPGDKD